MKYPQLNKTEQVQLTWHCGRQGRGKFIKSQILDSSFKKQELDFRPWHCGRQAEGSLNKVFDFGYGIVEGRGGSVNKELEFRSWHCGRGEV